MPAKYLSRLTLISSLLLLLVTGIQAQSSRPRRAQSQPKPKDQDSLLLPQPTPTPTARNTNVPLLDIKPVKPVGDTPAAASSSGGPSASTEHAYSLFEQKQYGAAAKEAREVAKGDPQNSEAWKLAGFSEFQLKQYDAASSDLQRALDLQRADKHEDDNTVDLLGEAYARSEKYDRALPLLAISTSRSGKQPDELLLFFRGLSEYSTGKLPEAEKSFNGVVKVNPKNSNALYYLAIISLKKPDLDGAIADLNRVTVLDPKHASAWTQLTSAYLRRASNATDETKADADYLNAVRAGEGLIKIRTDQDAIVLFGQALIGAKQYPRAAAALENAAKDPVANEVTLYLLGVAQSRAKNFPRAIAALERAAEKKADDVNVYRELGYAYEVTKQYAKALGAYQKGLALVPGDSDFKESVERVKPFAK